MGSGYRRRGPWIVGEPLRLTTEGLHTRRLFETAAVVSTQLIPAKQGTLHSK